MTKRPPRGSKTVVVGGGLSGLTAAHRILERDPAAELLVLEASQRPGGLLGTRECDGFVIETGPDSILSEKPAAIELARRLEIEDRLIRTRDRHRGAYVVNRGRLVRVPDGFSMMAPTRLSAWATTPLVSWRGKARAALDLVLPPRRSGEESLAAFVERRLGREVFDRLAQPLIGGIYGGDPARLSLEATMPRFIEMEREHGSVIRGMRARRGGTVEREATGARYGLFVAFDRGMQVLIDALVDRLGDRVRTSTPVEALEPTGRTWTVRAKDRAFEADRVILAVPAWRAAELVEAHHRRLADGLRSIPYGSAATVTLAWPRDSIPHALDAFGFVVPAAEHSSLLAATFSSVKWPGRAPEGQVLLRVFVGGVRAPDAVDLDDEELASLARRELRRLVGIDAPPRFTFVARYRRAMPQYHLGHGSRVDAIESMERDLSGVFFTGNAYRGVGIPDTIRHAESVVDRIHVGAAA